MSEPIPTWYIVLVVVRQEKRFLVVHEAKHGQAWFLPAGRVNVGETLEEAAIRETLEEAGIPVILDGIIRIEHTLFGDEARIRVIFAAHPADDTPPKSIPDEESLGAAWVTLPELLQLPLRSLEILPLFLHVAEGGTIYPLDILSYEGAPLP